LGEWFISFFVFIGTISIQEAVSLIVCNLLVLICWVHRYLNLQSEIEESEVEDKHDVPDKNLNPATVDSLDEILNICSVESGESSGFINEQAHSVTHTARCSV